MTEFDCPTCGKHYSFRDKFAGKKMLCADCRTNLLVPAAGSSVEILNTGEDGDTVMEDSTWVLLPEIISEKKENKRPVPIPPPLPPKYAVPPPVPDIAPIPPPVPPTGDEALIPLSVGGMSEDMEILSYIYEEKHLQRSGIIPPPRADNTAAGSLLTAPTTVPSSRRRRWLVRLKVFLCFAVLIGGTASIVWYLNLPGPDPRLPVLMQLNQKMLDAAVSQRQKEVEAPAVRLRAGESRDKTGELIDDYVVRFNENGALTPGSAAEKQLKETAAAIRAGYQKANTDEQRAVELEQQSELLKQEAAFWQSQREKLSDEVNTSPLKWGQKPPQVSMLRWEPPAVPKKIIKLDSDWTEALFTAFEFSGQQKPEDGDSEKDDVPLPSIFAVPDRPCHIYGEQSLRITTLKAEPVSFRFPVNVPFNEDLSAAKSVLFAVKFPERKSRILIGSIPEAGQIKEYRIRFRSGSGYAELLADSPRYCAAVFHEAQKQFQVIEVPLNGDEHWKRENHYTVPDDAFFTKIDSVEFMFAPCSSCTTFWLDGIELSNKVSREPFDLDEIEWQQELQRQKEKGGL
ncbi:MAG: hypothetical protein LBN39_02450 [Planctomycetaceae bacterium]|nr:hypothetical protein [Planctomycetaceae bacterium]